jgi:cell division protein YceG involved in septum cleavage
MAWVVAVAGCAAPSSQQEPVRVTIPRGATLEAVADTLHANQVIASPARFRLYATLLGRDRAIRAGVYDLYRHQPARAVLRTLVAGAAALHRLVIPEGLMLTEVATEV